MTDVPELIFGGKPPRVPIRAENLPLIAKLCRAGFHSYRKRWTKRLFKKPARLTFDIAYHGLRLGGRGTMVMDLPDGPRRLDFNGRKVHFRNLYHDYPEGQDPEVSAILETLLGGDRAFFDIGANWGYFAFYAATIKGYRGPIHAFEPVAETFADLENLTGHAGLSERITCHRLALSDRDGEGRMTFDPVNTGISRLVGANQDNSPGVESVPLARLDGLDLPAPWLLKVDVENHELEAFRGGETLLKTEKPNLVFENWIERNDPQVTLGPLRYLEELGYVLYLPRWRFVDAEKSYIWPASVPPGQVNRRDLAFIRFTAEARFQFEDQINAFACHRDRVGEITEILSNND